MLKWKQNLYFYLILFFVVNVLQAIFTPISKDEAYYWMFSQNLDWGFFDHPPMIALFVKLGNMLFGGVIGVRFMTTIFSTLTLFITWSLVPVKDKEKENAMMLFFLLAFSLPIFNIYGFITTPDVPLLFFSALYLRMYLNFLDRNSVINALLLGIVAALLMYSKYHGAFVIIFSVLAHIKLLWNRNFYLAGLVGIVLYFPHLLWQYNHDFISFRYHLVQRTDGFMGGKHILNYILNAFVILNPFLLGLFLYFFIKKKKDPLLPKVYYYIFWGFIGFFAFTSFRDHIEPQWIGVASIPMLIILLGFIQQQIPFPKYIKSIFIGSLVLIIIARIGLVLPLPVKSEFHKQGRSYYNTIKEKAKGDGVVFVNTYYDAAKYTFYTGDPAYSYNCYDYRKNQYDMWDYESGYHLKPAYFLSGYFYPWSDSSIVLEGISLHTERFEFFPMINKTSAQWVEMDEVMGVHSTQKIQFEVFNPYTYPLHFNDNEIPLRFFVVFQVGLDRIVVIMNTDVPDTIKPGETVSVNGSYIAKVPPGKYQLAIGLQPHNLSPLLITEKIGVEVFE